jgi:peptide-methionine (R)-S-oxide reductase
LIGRRLPPYPLVGLPRKFEHLVTTLTGIIRPGEDTMVDKVNKSDAEWREKLTPEQYKVARKKGTERRSAAKYWTTTPRALSLASAAAHRCSTRRQSTTRYGLAELLRTRSAENVRNVDDNSWFMRRTEVVCAACDAHLGTSSRWSAADGLRYCMNSAALKFDPASQALIPCGCCSPKTIG